MIFTTILLFVFTRRIKARVRNYQIILYHLLRSEQKNVSICENESSFLKVLPVDDSNTLDISHFTKKKSVFSTEQIKQLTFRRSGVTVKDYLSLVERQINSIKKYQNAEGRIEDPVEYRYDYYATPCYAHSVAALFISGQCTDIDLLHSGWQAMDCALADLIRCRPMRNPTNLNHYDFFTFPLMLAFHLYKKVSPEDRIRHW